MSMAATGRAHALATDQTTSLINKKCKGKQCKKRDRSWTMSLKKEENDRSTESFFGRESVLATVRDRKLFFSKCYLREYSVPEMAVKRKWYGLLQPDIGVASAGLRVKEMRKGCLVFTFLA